MNRDNSQFHATTVLGLRHNGKVVIVGDGQVTYGDTVWKAKARKVRKLYNDQVLAGFAGSAADAFTLFERFESRLEEFRGNLGKAAVELAKDWRTDRFLRRLDAQLAVLDNKSIFLISGNGDVIEPDDDIISVGSGAPYAISAARALMKHSSLSAKEIAKEAMTITSSLCIFTNSNLTFETLEQEKK
jgi:ATP-dependent HslUV protease, peptidase subunit HslV